jgi:hypothetical protein
MTRMDEQEARLILQAYRPGTPDESDPYFSEALQTVRGNPALGRWFAEEQAFDRAMAAQLAAIPAPFGLKTRILAQGGRPAGSARKRWVFGLAAALALVLLLAQAVNFWRTPKSVASQPLDYAREMTSFIELSPPLAMESSDLGTIEKWLGQKDPLPVQVPARMAALEPIGCRMLSFRGYDVTLICFQREGNRIAHLFAVPRAALPSVQPGEKPIFANEQGWMTATWAEADRVYMITLQGSRAELEQYLPSA